MADQTSQTPSNQPLDSSSLVYKHPPGFRLRRVRNWVFLGLTYATYYLCRYNLSIVAPQLKETFGFDNAQYGTIQMARAGAYGVGQFFNGLFTDRIGGKLAMTIGAVGTIILNVIFGITAWSNISWIFAALIIVRLVDGYVQAFGAPGMVKINTSWFRRQERGTFAGIFGFMINFGHSSAGQLWALLAKGFSIPLIFFTVTVSPMDWRYMFIVPPVIAGVVIILMNVAVKNHPEEAGYEIVHDDEDPDDDPRAHMGVMDVFRKITSNPIVWIVAAAYFCTGYVRSAINDWWTIYLNDVWNIGGKSALFWWMGVLALPYLAAIGSLGSGIISDKFFKGQRAPVAAVLYASQFVFILAAIAMSQNMFYASATVGAILILGIHVGCNATHSILGTAAAMDLGGRKMAGFAAGVIDSFQYFGAMLAGRSLGKLLDNYANSVTRTITDVDTAATKEVVVKVIDPTVWFVSMIPWTIVGTLLMGYLWWKHRGKGTAGT